MPVDAWLANYDVAGTGHDNIIVDNNGVAHRIDSGGGLRYAPRLKPSNYWNAASFALISNIRS
jgi:hypothetical protein